MNKVHEKGFVTIATGDIKYFLMARNLLYSYKIFANNPISFTLIADKENEHTKEFDNLVLIEDATQSYMDKLKLYKYTPYSETIFIDADSLAYDDLNIYWDYFERADDFSCFGKVLFDLDTTEGWFNNSGIAEFKDKITFITDLHGGIYYFRKTTRCKSIFETASYLANNYNRYSFRDFSEPADEPVLALSMSIHNCKPIEYDHRVLLYFPVAKKVKANIAKQQLNYMIFNGNEENVKNCILIHWANFYTSRALYRFEVDKLMLMRCQTKNYLLKYVFYDLKIMLVYYKLIDWLSDILSIIKFLLNKIMQIGSSH